jgi:cation diffusion facilitator CzcD-associated flavoprotein CzcO
LILAARLKALNVDFIVVEKNANVGDNWALRYDYLKFHTGRGWAEMPYLRKSSSLPFPLSHSIDSPNSLFLFTSG